MWNPKNPLERNTAALAALTGQPVVLRENGRADGNVYTVNAGGHLVFVTAAELGEQGTLPPGHALASADDLRKSVHAARLAGVAVGDPAIVAALGALAAAGLAADQVPWGAAGPPLPVPLTSSAAARSAGPLGPLGPLGQAPGQAQALGPQVPRGALPSPALPSPGPGRAARRAARRPNEPMREHGRADGRVYAISAGQLVVLGPGYKAGDELPVGHVLATAADLDLAVGVAQLEGVSATSPGMQAVVGALDARTLT